MASRTPVSEHFDYCYHPVHVIDDNKDIIVPCGKCAGCLLHQANVWSMRVGCEIESTPNSIFFTLTYSNKYLPTFKFIPRGSFSQNGAQVEYGIYTSHHDLNVRFNGKEDVLRSDDIEPIESVRQDFPITNYSVYLQSKGLSYKTGDYISYLSKRDIQLWLKLIRKDLNDNFYGNSREIKGFRYFIIGELGETLFRCHYHGVIFPSDAQQAAFILEHSLYKNWQMCVPSQFFPYAHFCDSGVRGYITQYLNSFVNVPKIYKENKGIGRLRLASKSPAIGFVLQNKAQIFEDVSAGIIEYTKTVKRVGSPFTLVYPKDFCASVFPKCYRFGTYDFSRLLNVYGSIWQALCSRFGREYRKLTGITVDLLLSYFRAFLHPLDYNAASRCYHICTELGFPPFHYLYCLDMYYYKRNMLTLKMWYEFQEKYISDPLLVIASYSTSFWFLKEQNPILLANFAEGFRLDVDYLLNADLKCFQNDLHRIFKDFHSCYVNEVSAISQDMVKLPKFKELINQSPISNF